MRQARQVRRELLIGLGIWTVPILVLLAVFRGNHLAAVLGTLLGTAAAAVLIFHMYRHLDIALDMDAKHAQSHIQIASFQRVFIMGAVLAVSFMFPIYFDPVGVVLGIFGVKISALMYPVLHPQYEKRRKRKA
jgi:ATP synthase I chain.